MMFPISISYTKQTLGVSLPGSVSRWRFLHGLVHESLSVFVQRFSISEFQCHGMWHALGFSVLQSIVPTFLCCSWNCSNTRHVTTTTCGKRLLHVCWTRILSRLAHGGKRMCPSSSAVYFIMVLLKRQKMARAHGPCTTSYSWWEHLRQGKRKIWKAATAVCNG